MLDIHTHILPNIDDGALDEEMALKMLEMLCEDGVKNVILTPHFYSHMESLDDFLSKRSVAYQSLISNNVSQLDINIYLGAEVYITEYLRKYDDLSRVCINNTDYMLIEFPFDDKLTDRSIDILEYLIYDCKIKPIIAHVERYPFIQNMEDVGYLIDKGCLIQINTDSLLSVKSRKFVLKLIKNGKVNFIGSDSHNLTSRAPKFGRAIKVINSKLNSGYVDNICKFSKDII